MTEAWQGIAAEFLHNYPSGARLVAVTGADPTRSRLAADGVARALEAGGVAVERADASQTDAARLRAELVAPFRRDRSRDRVLVVSGPEALISDEARGLWHFTLWQSAGDEPTHPGASSLVDVTDPKHPFRRYADACGTADCCND